ncbi:GNAT family N-acetyltransferase [Martelella alba]|uniref:GNAT family N-acetyltransferase n=1 Tax=Martelella alba TaxID=2590451 RepID=A0ABY2SHW0_9HYPH|nr:GNAT family N-acetyltransferase [Martelella alba]TKI04931.1 GNAT family N-acetyltransferase [Martelella alba]
MNTKIRLASPDEANELWNIRNQAIRHGCASSYAASVILAWTPDDMPDSFRQLIDENTFFVAENSKGKPLATGFLDLSRHSVEAICTLPAYMGKGLARAIINAIKKEAGNRGFTYLTLSSTPNAVSFYLKQGFVIVSKSLYPSKLAGTHLACFNMKINLNALNNSDDSAAADER